VIPNRKRYPERIGLDGTVAFVEETFGIQVPDQDVVYDNFKSVSALEEYLHQHNK
jgi:acyl carrier protein